MKIAMSLLSGISYGGVAYWRNLCPALARIDKINEYHIFVQKNHPLLHRVNQNNFIFHECNMNIKSAFMRLFWEQFILPFEIKKRKIDIMFTAKNANILFAPCKTIISIRNMEPLCYAWYKNYWKLNVFSRLRNILTKISIKKADKIIAVSKNTKNYLTENLPSAKEKIEVIYNGNPVVNSNKENQVNKKKGISFLFSSSKFVAYANQLNLIQGYEILNNKKMNDLPPLYLAGGVLDKIYYRKIKNFVNENKLTKKIKFLGLIPHESLVKLYSRATAFLFPSTLEACPQTLIEAMACGVPIAASNVPPMPEICENAAIYFDPFDKNDIAEKINLIITDENLQSRLKKTSLERAHFFDWEKTALNLIKVFQKVHKKNN